MAEGLGAELEESRAGGGTVSQVSVRGFGMRLFCPSSHGFPCVSPGTAFIAIPRRTPSFSGLFEAARGFPGYTWLPEKKSHETSLAASLELPHIPSHPGQPACGHACAHSRATPQCTPPLSLGLAKGGATTCGFLPCSIDFIYPAKHLFPCFSLPPFLSLSLILYFFN